MSKETSSVSTYRYHKEGQYNTVIGVKDQYQDLSVCER